MTADISRPGLEDSIKAGTRLISQLQKCDREKEVKLIVSFFRD